MKSIYLLLTFLFVGCASIHNGNYAKKDEQIGTKESLGTDSNAEIVISGKEVESMSSEYFTLVDLTFENKTNAWQDLKDIEISFADPVLNKTIRIPVGEQLYFWGEAAKQQQRIHDHNVGLFLGGVALLSTAAVIRTTNDYKQKGALAAGGVALGAMTARGYKRGLDRLEFSKLVPESHILNNSFVIPPGLHTKKWLTLYAKNPYKIPYLAKMIVSYKLNGKQEKVTLRFRDMHLKGTKFQAKYAEMVNNKMRQEENPNWSPY